MNITFIPASELKYFRKPSVVKVGAMCVMVGFLITEQHSAVFLQLRAFGFSCLHHSHPHPQSLLWQLGGGGWWGVAGIRAPESVGLHFGATLAVCAAGEC